MTTTVTIYIPAVELFCEAGFEPSDMFEHMNSRTGEWFAARYDALTWTASGLVLAATERDDMLTLTLLTSNGVTCDELRFSTDGDGNVSATTAAAFLAVAGAWS